MSKISSDAGFTLMELIAVLFIISIMLAFAVPEFSRNMMRNDTKTTLNWIVFNVSKFKKEARYQGKDFSMCIHPATNLIQIKTGSTDPESTEANILAEFLVPEDVTLDGVDFNRPGQESDDDDDDDDDDDACIQFYGKGYSDHAIVHISDNDGNFFSCMIQPFLHRVKIYKEYVQFE